MSTYSFTGNKVSFTYQRLLQISNGGDGNPNGIIYDGYGATVTIADENINNLYTTVNSLISSGISGSTGPQGLQGLDGTTGTQGLQGLDGTTGPQGLQGLDGITGPQGLDGSTGPQGLQGLDGITGPQGSQGPTGDYSPFYYQDTTPSTALPAGSRWFDSLTGEELVLIDDGDSKQWVQPYYGGGGGGGGGVGTQGPQGISGIGVTGPQGPGSSSFLYTNVLFVHPNGDNNTAVIGDRSLPFNTLFGAISAAASVTNPVIEVWSGDTYDPITPVYEYTEENKGITIDYDLTIYLKPGSHIRFIPDRDVESFFTIVSGARVNIVGDEKSSSFVLNTTLDGSRFFDVIGSKLYIENISLYFDHGKITTGNNTAFDITYPGKGSSDTILSLKNCYLEFLEANQTISNFSSITNDQSVVEIDNCQLYLQASDSNNSGFINFIKNDVKTLADCISYIRNSQFITSRNENSTAVLSIIYNNDVDDTQRSKVVIDDCQFYIDSNVGSKGIGPYILASNLNFKNVSLVSRSIHNYPSTDDSSVTYITGNPSSLDDLGIAGYGFLESYNSISIPFIRK